MKSYSVLHLIRVLINFYFWSFCLLLNLMELKECMAWPKRNWTAALAWLPFHLPLFLFLFVCAKTQRIKTELHSNLWSLPLTLCNYVRKEINVAWCEKVKIHNNIEIFDARTRLFTIEPKFMEQLILIVIWCF